MICHQHQRRTQRGHAARRGRTGLPGEHWPETLGSRVRHGDVGSEDGQASTRHRHRQCRAAWVVVGAPSEPANTLEMTEETLVWLYPDAPKALPPALEPARSTARPV
jgi:hypothetical protein